MSDFDLIQRFMFDNSQIRGELAQLKDTYQTIIKQHAYPKPVQRLLGEWITAAVMLSSSIKFDGTLTLQARGTGNIKVLMAECRHNQDVRAWADWDGDIEEGASLPELLGSGQLAITIDPDSGKSYQGVVPLDGDTLAECLEHYFAQSEQLQTRIWLQADDEQTAGLLLQELPGEEKDPDIWDRISHLASTITKEEMLQLDHLTQLTRLFHEEEVRIFDPLSVEFKCTCSRERSGNAIRSVGQEEAEDILKDKGKISMDCQFCSAHYDFNAVEVAELFIPGGSSKTVH